MSDNDSVVNNPLFGAMIGTQIGNNAHAAANEMRAEAQIILLKDAANNGVRVAESLSETVKSLRNEVHVFSGNEVDYAFSIAGVRGVTRELLEELRRSDPNNPLLNKKVRDRIFEASSNNISKKLTGINNPDKARSINPQVWRDEAYGAVGSDCGGPEKSKITPNIQVRAEAEVPSHTPDREKFLGLIEKLSAELKKANPNAPILTDKVMLDVFADYTLNEMERQEKAVKPG